jgi:hypothetical protein
MPFGGPSSSAAAGESAATEEEWMTDRTQTLRVGDVAPGFELMDQNDETNTLSDRRGRKNHEALAAL